jgi:RND family efflux transporter MFP subunit
MVLWFVVCGFAAGTGCGGKNAAPSAEKTPSAGTVTGQAPPPAAAPHNESEVVALGLIVVENQVDVSAQRDGLVAKVLVDIGNVVRRGQTLALLDDRQITADRDAAQSKLRSIEADVKNWEAETQVAEADLARAEKLMEAQVITREQLEHARYKVVASRYEVEREQNNYRYAEATLRSLQLELEKTRIVAPFDGVVARRYIHVGQKIAKADRLFWVSAVGPKRVHFTLPGTMRRLVRNGQAVIVSATDMLEQPAKVVQISPLIDPASGTVEVMAELDGSAHEFVPGMTVNVRMEKRP